MELLKYSEFVDLAPDDLGASVRVNHDDGDCSGSSNSLKIERKYDGSISAYCFRCGKRGFYSDGFSRIKAYRAKAGDATAQPNSAGDKYKRPRDTSKITSEWPAYAINWIKQWGITNDEILEHGIGYSAYFDRIIIDIRWLGDYHGYASRAVNPTDNRPKWLMFSDSTPFYTKTIKGEGKTLVLVEDIISAIRISRELDCIALLTTTISSETLANVAHYSKFIVWLDDDNRQVKLNQLKLYKRLSTFGECKVIHSTDPKRMTDESIRKNIFW